MTDRYPKPLEIQVRERLLSLNLTLASAESCTGGLISSRITDVSGSSVYFLGGIIAYSNEIKMRFLDVPEEMLTAFGAVSAEVAGAMARGARQHFQTDLAVSATGIAGPGGGTAEKPVGLTFIGIATATSVNVRRFVWEGDRIRNKRMSADAALQLILDTLA